MGEVTSYTKAKIDELIASIGGGGTISDAVMLTGDQTVGGVKTFSADRIKIGNIILIKGTGSPENVEAAPVGSWFFRDDGGIGTTAYRKESGTGLTGWVADINGSPHPDVDAHDLMGLAKQSELNSLDAAVVKLAGSQVITGTKTFEKTVTFSDGASISAGATDGIRLGTAADQKIGFYGAAAVTQPAANPDTSGATLAALETEVNEIKALLRSLGLMSVSGAPVGGDKGYLGSYLSGY